MLNAANQFRTFLSSPKNWGLRCRCKRSGMTCICCSLQADRTSSKEWIAPCAGWSKKAWNRCSSKLSAHFRLDLNRKQDLRGLLRHDQCPALTGTLATPWWCLACTSESSADLVAHHVRTNYEACFSTPHLQNHEKNSYAFCDQVWQACFRFLTSSDFTRTCLLPKQGRTWCHMSGSVNPKRNCS